jgi:transcriptional regulator with XRE-family HTH domain
MAPTPGVAVNGTAIKALRQKDGWNSGKFAAAAGISTAHLSNVEAGRKRRVSPAAARRIADALGVPLLAITHGLPPEQVAS